MPEPLTPESIIELRCRLDMTQAAFAALIGCGQGAVSMWEEGKRTPTGLYAKAIRELMEKHPPE